MRVAIVDDEPDLAAEMARLAESAGMTCEIFADGTDVVTALRRSTFDVVLLDWNMPNTSGIEVLRWATDRLETPPAFILLTARGDTDDVVRGLEAGATDYIIKPEEETIILARIRAAARRTQARPRDRQTAHGRYSIDMAEDQISLDGQPVKLTAKEFALARVFLENIDRPLSRSYLLGEIWGSSDLVETRTLDMHVSRVRSKLSLRAENGLVIQTVFGFGYRMDSIKDNDSNGA
ncbi:response regulator [Altererythrobacter xixiisoli]|uniref:Response regulator n=1 Tax=Croceibacterium xixiisoli TaxID=1476466 RepID=A0A6I4TQC7_9SPHN|nr:response regulator transcription factor [Croceibacterium xixiisoli]MXO98355.1 response regulator [Croceibacterium xixiisoli]